MNLRQSKMTRLGDSISSRPVCARTREVNDFYSYRSHSPWRLYYLDEESSLLEAWTIPLPSTTTEEKNCLCHERPVVYKAPSSL